MSDQQAYTIVKTLIEKKDELVAVHREAKNITLDAQAAASHPFQSARASTSRSAE